MRVKDIRIYIIPCGNRRPVMVEITTDDGTSGIGEAGIGYGVGGEAVAAMIAEMAQRFVLGRDPFRIEEIWNDIYDHSFWTKGGGPIGFAALSAIEQALWDIKGKAFGLAVHDFLGGRMWDRLPVYANGWWMGCSSGSDYARAGEATVARGYKALKLYPLGMPDPLIVVRHPTRRRVDHAVKVIAVERVRELRKAIGPDIAIMLDLGGGLTTDETLWVARRIEEYDVQFIEEPADPFNLEAIAKIAAGTIIPIALGERHYTRYGFQKVFASGAVDIIQPDIGNTGGIFEAKKIAAIAEVHNIRVAPHNYGGPLATVVAAQLDATLPNFMIQEFFPDFAKEKNYTPILLDPLEDHVENGTIPVPEGPGLGVSLNRAAVDPYLWRECRSP